MIGEKVISHVFGNEVYCIPITQENITTLNNWRYVDNDDENTVENMMKRKCPQCKLHPTEEGHDPCIANLPDVEYTCCGHGIENSNNIYVKYNNGETIRFKSLELLKEHFNIK